MAVKATVLFAMLVLTACQIGVAQLKPLASGTSLEPSYKGKPLSHWVKVLSGVSLSSRTWPEIDEIEGGAEAQEAIQQIGAQAVPFLLPQIPGHGAMIAFRELGPRARSAIPELVTMATNEAAAAAPEPSKTAGMAIGMDPLTVLGWIGTDAVPAISMILSNYNGPGIRFSALQALTIVGSGAAPAGPAVLPCVNDENEMVARDAVSVLGQIGARQTAALQV